MAVASRRSIITNAADIERHRRFATLPHLSGYYSTVYSLHFCLGLSLVCFRMLDIISQSSIFGISKKWRWLASIDISIIFNVVNDSRFKSSIRPCQYITQIYIARLSLLTETLYQKFSDPNQISTCARESKRAFIQQSVDLVIMSQLFFAAPGAFSSSKFH